jgi:hypothetical protein
MKNGKLLGIRSSGSEYVFPLYSSAFQPGPVSNLVEALPNLAVLPLRLNLESYVETYDVCFLHVFLDSSANRKSTHVSRIHISR